MMMRFQKMMSWVLKFILGYHKRKPSWERELIQYAEKYGAPEGTMRQSKKPKPFSSYMALMCDLVEKEPTCFEEVVQKKEWMDALTEEY
jgi:hypothetical protein